MTSKLSSYAVMAAKWYAVGGALYAGSWLVDRAIRTSKGLLPSFTAMPKGRTFVGHTASDFLLWPMHLWNVVGNLRAAGAVGADPLMHLPIIGALRIPAVAPALPPRPPESMIAA